MTLTSPRPGTRVASRGTRARSFASAGAWLLALLLLIAPSTVGGPAFAGGPRSIASATPEPEELTGETVFTLSPVGRGTVRAGESLAVSVTLQNGTDAVAPAYPVTLSLGSTALADRAALSSWLGGDGTGGDVVPVGTVTLEPVPSGAEATEGIVLAPEDPALAVRAPGVYPLVASYDGPEGAVRSTSVMIVPDDALAEVGVGVVVPVTAYPIAEAILTATELVTLTAPDGSLTQQLDAVDGTDAILAVDPAIPAAIRVLGSAAPVTALEWLTRLEALPNSRFALQFGDADVATQLEAGAAKPLKPASLQYAMRAADFRPVVGTTPTRTPAPTPDPTPAPASTATSEPVIDPTAPVYPTTAEVVAVDGAREGVYWPAAGSANPDVVAALGALTVDDRASLTLLPSTSTTAGAGGATVPAHATASGADVLVYDADVSRELRAASLSDDSPLRGAPLTAATAYLAFATAETSGQSGGRPLLVTVDRAENRSSLALRTAITAAVQAPGVSPVGLGGLAGASPVEVTVTDAEADAARVAQASALFEDEAAIGRFATILDDVTLLTGPERAEVLQLLGVGWLTDPVAWNTAVDDHRAETTETLNSVGILPPSAVNLFSADAPLPVWVRNDLPYPITVVLYASPDDLRLTVQEQTVTPANAQSNTRVQVPVQTRVASGQVNIDLQLRSRTFEPIGAPQVVEVNVRAEWEGIGITVLAVLVGGFVVIGVVRTVLRLRARRRGEPS
jgi:hypothetical protein